VSRRMFLPPPPPSPRSRRSPARRLRRWPPVPSHREPGKRARRRSFVEALRDESRVIPRTPRRDAGLPLLTTRLGRESLRRGASSVRFESSPRVGRTLGVGFGFRGRFGCV